MKVEQYDTVLLKDGRQAAIIEVYDKTRFLADIGDSPQDWNTIDISIDDIEQVIV